MGETTKPKNCLNCFSEDILGPYRNKCGIIIGLITSVRQEVYVCAECGHTMQFTIKSDWEMLLRDRKRKLAEATK